MSIVLFIIFILAAQFLCGWGLLRKFLSGEPEIQKYSLSLISGMVTSTFAVFILELFKIPITRFSFILVLLIFVVTLNIRYKDSLRKLKESWKNIKWDFKAYELIPVLCIAYAMVVSFWRCLYSPITPFDTLTGIDLVAKYAIQETTIASSVFTQHLPEAWQWSNQPYYAPFTMLMQIIYRLTGLAFGKIWLSFLVITFYIYFYSKLKETVHPILAGLMLILFTATPELFAYTFMVQTDYSNMIFFTIGTVFFYKYFLAEKDKWQPLIVSILFFGFACWTRSETFFFLPFGALMILYKEFKLKEGKPLVYFQWAALFVIVPTLFFILWNNIYVHFYLPISPDNSGMLKFEFQNYISSLFEIAGKMNKQVVFQSSYWSYIVPVFLTYFIANVLIFRNAKGSVYAFWILIIYVVFVLMLKHIADVNIAFTFRRGFFKVFPLMLLYMANSTLFIRFSKAINKWEYYS